MQTLAEGEGPRILLVRLSAIGDCVHALPLMSALRQRHPAAHLGWAIGGAGHALLEGHPEVDRFHVVPRRERGLELVRRWRELVAEIRRQRYDVAFDVQGLLKSALVARVSGARLRIGFDGEEAREGSGLLTNRKVAPRAGSRHVVDKNLDLLTALGVERPRWRWTLPDYRPSTALGAWLRTSLAGRSYAVVHPGTTWATKVWPAERFGRVAAALGELGLASVVTWAGEREAAWARQVVAAADLEAVVMAPPTDLRDQAALTAGARLFLGNDSGPMHLAVALEVPTVAVFGATDPIRNGPYTGDGARHRAVTGDEELACWPCWRGRCARGDLACLERLGTSRVTAACRAVLADGASGGEAWCAREDSNL